MDKTMYNEEMKHLLKFQDAHAPRLFFGLEEDIRLAVLKDEVDLWQKRGTRNMWLRDTLKERVKELEQKLFIKESERRERDKL